MHIRPESTTESRSALKSMDRDEAVVNLGHFRARQQTWHELWQHISASRA